MLKESKNLFFKIAVGSYFDGRNRTFELIKLLTGVVNFKDIIINFQAHKVLAMCENINPNSPTI